MTTARITAPKAAAERYSRKPKRSAPGARVVPYLFLGALIIYFLIPIWWLVVASTKNVGGLFNGSAGALWFDKDFAFGSNLADLFTYNGGIYLQWLGNSLGYALAGGIGATILAVLAGYGFAKFKFRGRRLFFSVLLGSVMVPLTALVIPTFVLLSELNLTDTIWAVILPSLISPFGLYLIWTYASEAVPTELLEAARMDGASEFRTFFTIALRLLSPGLVTVLLFTVVATWNNYFLPLIMLSEPNLYPLTVGLNEWNSQASGVAAQPIYNLVITGSLLTIVPIVIAFLFLQRFWQSGLSAGSVKQ